MMNGIMVRFSVGNVRGVRAGGRDREVDAAERQLLDVLGVVAQLAAAEHLHLVAPLGVVLDLLGKHLGRSLACALPAGRCG
jgi:hypothetical protein